MKETVLTNRFKASGILFPVTIIFYMINICGILFTVILNSFSKGWFKGFLPPHYTTEWYVYAANDHNIANLILVTFIVAFIVIVISLIVSFPTAYVFARYSFPFKNALMGLFLLPMIIPPITYGIPLATVLYKMRLAETIGGVIIANLVPIIPFMILILTPFIEQIDVNMESAAKMLGARKTTVFFKILTPLALPGILTAAILSIVKTISMFELTFLVAGAKSQTIVVALFSDAFSPGSRPFQAIDALAVIYFLITMTSLVISLRFVSPTQMVFKIK